MSAELTILLSVVFLIALTALACADSIRIFRDILRQKLEKREKYFAILMNAILPGFAIFGFVHFHEKDLRQSLQKFKNIKLYRDFMFCHTWFYVLAIACNPDIMWDVLNSGFLAFLLYIAFVPCSLFFAFLSFAFQLPNFFDRHPIIDDNR